jgi:hypothetical protein
VTYEDYLAKNKIDDTSEAKIDFARYQNDLLSDSARGIKGKEYPTTVMNRAALAEHLSKYGSTNFQELMAETWTGYQHNGNPSDFVREMGQLMDDALIDFLDDTQAGPEAEFRISKLKGYQTAAWPKGVAIPDEASVIDIFEKAYPRNSPSEVASIIAGEKDWTYNGNKGSELAGLGFFRDEKGQRNNDVTMLHYRYQQAFADQLVKGDNAADVETLEAFFEKMQYSDQERKAYMLGKQHADAVRELYKKINAAGDYDGGGRHRAGD